jgi:hypothetical protein
VELLETRTVPAAPSWTQQFALDNVAAGAVLTAAPALNLQSVPTSGASIWRDLVQGAIAANSSQVDWYQLTLTATAHLTLTTFDTPGSTFAGVISLYNNDPDALVDNALLNGGFVAAPNDPLDPLGHRLVAQAQGTTGGGTTLTWDLAAGTYYVAVSGAGNSFFHPFLAGSGLPGSSGGYRLAIEADALSTSGPVVLESNPTNNAFLAASPLVLRADLNQGIDPSSLIANQPSGNTVQLLYSSDGTFTTGVQPIYIDVHFSPDPTDLVSPGCDEIQVTPVAPLNAGYYELVLKGIGQLNSTAPDTIIQFQIGNGEPDDTAATAHNLGDLSQGAFTQLVGAIGDDPYYAFFDPNHNNPLSPDYALPANYAGADVNLYHFTITAPGNYILLSEVFAGRIGSPLDAGLSLFQRQRNQLVLVTANDNTLNNTTAVGDNGYFGTPLSLDPFLSAGLGAGDYYLAVSSGPNTPDASQGRSVGVGGVFDPNISHSGSGVTNANSFTIGSYILNVRVAPNPGAPHIVSVSPAGGGNPIAPPTNFVVRFDQAMNLQQEAYAAFQFNSGVSLNSIFVQGPNGIDYYPRMIGYDPTTFTATFQLLDALPNGVNALHLSGPKGLDNLGGTPLAGNTPGGDYVVTFTVAGSPAGSGGGQVILTDQEPNNSLAQAQNLGVLFPAMEQAGIPIVRDFSQAPPGSVADTADYYAFQVTQARQYTFTLTGSNLPPGTAPILMASDGSTISAAPNLFAGGVSVTAFLLPGSYMIGVGGWTPTQAQNVSYRLYVSIGQVGDNPTPLTIGAAPAVSIRLVNGPSPSPPVVVLPPSGSGITPASLPNANTLPALVNLLPNSVLANGAIGGIPGTGRALASNGKGSGQAASYGAVRDLMDLIVLTQIGVEAPPDEEPISWLPWVESFTLPVRESWEQLRDMVFQLGDWLNLTIAPPSADTSGPDPTEDVEMEDGDNREAKVIEDDPFALPDCFEGHDWVAAVAALALVQASRPRQGQRRIVTSPKREQVAC